MSAVLGRSKRKPSDYPTLAFHLSRLGQLLSALIVAIVLIFFVHQLHLEHYYIPWTFLLLLVVSLLTLVSFFGTSAFHFFGTLNARHNLLANALLSILWILGLSLLTWNLGWTLSHRCVKATWHNSDGIMVCRLYKSLTAFTVTGTVSTLLALGLDLKVRRQTRQRGVYNQMLDIKGPSNVRSSSPFHQHNDAGLAGEPQSDIMKPYRTQRFFEAQQFGYEQPNEQTSYAGGVEGDLGYADGREHAW